MRKLFSKKTGCLVIASSLVLGVVGGHLLSNSLSSSAKVNVITAEERLQAKRDEAQTNSYSIDRNADLNETVRAIITLEADSVAESVSKSTDVSEYTSKLKSKEKKIIKNQKDIVKDVEKLTDNKVINQTGYLVNSFSIDAKRSELKKISKIDGVDKVYEATMYETCMETAIDEGNVTAQLEAEQYGYTGEGVVIAIVDTGVNYQHQDMKLDEGVKTKYTKEEWKEKIELLGYGKYMSDKVPFGYDYTTATDECLNVSAFHGYHVSAIAAGNGKINGVAKNAQVLGLNVFGTGWGATSDAIVKGVEDAVKLGADIINMSLGSDKSIVSDEDYIQVAVENASKEGVICCISAGNSGTSSGSMEPNNLMNMKDTAMIGTPSATYSSLSVASADNIVTPESINMSSFSSWGPTNELNIKPEITAPGGNIKAALTGVDDYEVYSGTSMSSPYVAGSQAIMLNAIKARGLDLSGEKLVKFMKNSLMNTADVIIDERINAPYPVRNQGAGMVDVYGAVDNQVIVTCKDEAKVELGELTGTTTFDMVLTNYGKEACVYVLNNSQIYTDYTINTKTENEVSGEYGIKPVEGASITYNMNRVEVPAGGSVTVTATVNIPENYENNSFVEAFVILEGEGVQDLGLPVLGFYGKWDSEPIMDKSVYEEGESMLDKATMLEPISGGSALTADSHNGYEILGLQWEKVKSLEVADDILSKNASIKDGITEKDKHCIDKIEKNQANNIILEEGIEYDIMSDKDGFASCQLRVAEDGYYTFDFKEMDITYINIYSHTYEGDEFVVYNSLYQSAEYGNYFREFKLSKNKEYFIEFSINGAIQKEKLICKALIYKSSGENAYTLIPKFNGDAVAFSPNDDGVKDSTIPKIAMYRCAKELKVRVLDSEKKSIRTLATKTDEKKLPFGFIGGEYYSSNINDSSSNTIVDWDGKVYNKEKGEYEYAQPGQYYIQVEAKITKDAIPQVITMPVKIDNVKPEVETFNVSQIEGNTVVEFSAKDNLAINGNFYIDIARPRNNALTYAKKYAETAVNQAGNYVVNLGKLESAEITLLVEDMAGNQVFKNAKVGENEENDVDVDLTDETEFNLCQGVSISPIIENGASYDSYQGMLWFEGECENDITITINGVEATYSTDGILHVLEEGKRFDINVPIIEKATNQLLHVVVCKGGAEIFNKTFDVIVDARPVTIEMISNDKVLNTKSFMNGNMNVMLLENIEGQSYKAQFKVDGYSQYDNMDSFLRIYPWDENAEMLDHKITYEGNGVYTLEIEKMAQYVDVSTEIIYGECECISKDFMLTTNEETFKEKCREFEQHIDSNIYCFYNMDQSMLNEDGTITVTGSTPVMPDEVEINGQKAEVNPETFEFSCNVPVKKGMNYINIIATISGEKVIRGTAFIMDDVTLTLDKSITEVDGVINTDQEIFNLAGTIKSYSNVVSIDVNGDNLYCANDFLGTTEDKPFEKSFDYNIKLNKGVNKIALSVKTYGGGEIEKLITVNYN